MQHTSLARKAGIIGMVGGICWIVSIIMEFGFGVESGSGSLARVNELLSLTAMIGMNIGFLGLVWGGAFRGWFGALAVGVHVLGYTLILVGGVAGLLFGEAAGPLFILFPIDGALEGPSQSPVGRAGSVGYRCSTASMEFSLLGYHWCWG